jgi:nitrite reductase/ring-hydroxylating ferredoxin subunit
MSIMSQAVDVSLLLNEGSYYILDQYALREEMYAKVVDTFLDGVAAIAGRACRDRVAAAGLGQLHRFFPVEDVLLLEDYLLRRLRNDLYYWSFRVGRETLGLAGTFYVDYLIVIRIHYPFMIARQARRVKHPAKSLKEQARLLLAAARDWRLLANLLGKRLRAVFRKRSRQDSGAFNPNDYHRSLPDPARSHGPHVDTWYGHSYDGVNLWWAIDGVTEDNTVILYPETFGHTLPFDPRSMYVAPGITLPRPVKPALEPGQLLVFNPETLHGTQVNISDRTRVVISTRLNPDVPRFDPHAPFHFEHWFSSQDLEQRRFGRIRVFARTKYQGRRRQVRPRAPLQETPAAIACPQSARLGQPVRVCASHELEQGGRLAVDLENARLLLVRCGNAVVAYSRVCPHLGIDLADGHYDGTRVFCPGHGIAYSVEDGSSGCAAFRLRAYHAFEQEGAIFVEPAGADGASCPAATQE